jgi:hypothetical protein
LKVSSCQFLGDKIDYSLLEQAHRVNVNCPALREIYPGKEVRQFGAAQYYLPSVSPSEAVNESRGGTDKVLIADTAGVSFQP